MEPKMCIGIIGGSRVTDEIYETAHALGAHCAASNIAIVCGGLGGVMEAAAKGASEKGGLTIGILPSTRKEDANPYIKVAIPTGMGVGRNILVVQAADACIAFPGSYGTLSEMALALNLGKTVIFMPGAWDLRRIGKVDGGIFKEAIDVRHAVGLALDSCLHS